MTPSEWVLRPYDASTDENLLVYTAIKSLAHSRAGRAAQAHHDTSPAEATWWDATRPLVLWLGANVDIVMAADVEDPNLVYGYAATSGDVVHLLCVKRSAHAAGFGAELTADLLAGRLDRRCAYTLPMVELQRVPASWYPDPLWLPSRILSPSVRHSSSPTLGTSQPDAAA
jgi:hypothetical protein